MIITCNYDNRDIDVEGDFVEEFIGCDSLNPSFYDPGCSGYINGLTVFIKGVDITDMLKEEVLGAIEQEALNLYFEKN